jgi:predicted house-cleaning noncanonical NTP pyrophosphatase (MazG superfamily)
MTERYAVFLTDDERDELVFCLEHVARVAENGSNDNAISNTRKQSLRKQSERLRKLAEHVRKITV